MLALTKKDSTLLVRCAFDTAGALLSEPVSRDMRIAQFNAGYPDLMQRL